MAVSVYVETGIGMSMVANRFSEVRAALVWNMTTAKNSRRHNDAQCALLRSSRVRP